MLFHELEDGMYSVTSYFCAKVNAARVQQGAASLHALKLCKTRACSLRARRSWGSYRNTVCSP